MLPTRLPVTRALLEREMKEDARRSKFLAQATETGVEVDLNDTHSARAKMTNPRHKFVTSSKPTGKRHAK